MSGSLDDLLGLGSRGAPGPGGGGPTPVGVSSAPDPMGAAAGDGGGAGVGVGDNGSLRMVSVQAIEPSSRQPRTSFDERELDELAASISALGVLQPVLVRNIDGYRYELIAGERRWRAAKRAGLREIPALVRSVSDRESLEQAVVENLQRSDLNALEEGAAYRQLIDEFGLTQEDVAIRVGKSRAAVTNTLRLLGLPTAVQALIRSGELTAGHARALLGLDQPALQAGLAARIVREGLSVRQVEELVREATRRGRPAAEAERRDGGMKPAPALEIERLLTERLDTRVNVSLSGGGRGRLVIEFADLDDLDRVYQALVQGETEPGW